MRSAFLCVDDDNTVLDTLRSLLFEKYNKKYIIEMAESGEEALELLEEFQEEGIELKLVISDYIMPHMKGDELLIKLHEHCPQAIKIMLTGQSSLEGVVNTINHANLYRFITKPWDNQDLIMTVESGVKSYDQESILKRQNAELKMFNEELEQRVLERTKELSDLNRSLQERVHQEVEKRQKQEQLLQQQSKMAAMGEMIGMITHQWKQPLNMVTLFAQEIAEVIQYEKANPKKLLDIQKKILDQTQHMDETISDFKNFFKPSAKKQYFKVGKLAREVSHLLEAKIKSSHIALLVHDDDDFEILGYPNDYRQVIMNLFNNACDVLIERQLSNGMIEFFSESDSEGGIIIRIRDNGGGIPEELLPERLFEAYVSTKGEKGTGIGLQICKTIVEEKFDGILWVHNVHGGAEFVISFPKTMGSM